MPDDAVILDRALEACTVRLGADILMVTSDEGVAWDRAVAASSATPHRPALTLIVRSGPKADAAVSTATAAAGSVRITL